MLVAACHLMLILGAILGSSHGVDTPAVQIPELPRLGEGDGRNPSNTKRILLCQNTSRTQNFNQIYCNIFVMYLYVFFIFSDVEFPLESQMYS